MTWFRRTPPFDDPELGRLTRTGSIWYPSADREGLGVVIVGGKDSPDPSGVELARQLLKDASRLIPLAEAFVQADARATAFSQGNGSLTRDGFTVYESGEFAVEFGLSGWPDAMISVRFRNGAPVEVQLGD